MSSVSPVDELRLIIRSALEAKWDSQRGSWLDSWFARTPNAWQIIGDLNKEDILAAHSSSVAWIAEHFSNVPNTNIETWVYALKNLPFGAGKDPQEVFTSFEFLNAVLQLPVGDQKRFAKDEQDIINHCATAFAHVLRLLPADKLHPQQSKQVLHMLTHLPDFLSTDAAIRDTLGSIPFLWLGPMVQHMQRTNHPKIVYVENLLLGMAYLNLDRKTPAVLNMLEQILPNLRNSASTLDFKVGARPANYMHFGSVLNAVDKHLNWSEDDKQKFLPDPKDFLRHMRTKIVPDQDIRQFVDDLFHYPIDRMSNAPQTTTEIVQRFQHYIFCSLFANNKSNLEQVAAVLRNVPPAVMQLMATVPPQALDVYSIEQLVGTQRLGMKDSLAKLLASNKRKNHSYTQLRNSILAHLPPTLATAGQLMLHWASPEEYSKPNGQCVALAVNPRAKHAESTNLEELRAVFLNYNLSNATAEQYNHSVARNARKI